MEHILDWFWVDPSMEIPIDATRIVECIRAGVRNGDWVYYEADSERAWTDRDAPPPVRVSSDSFLMTPARAAETGVVAPQLTAALVEATVVAAGGTIDGPALYDRLEKETGKRPTKRELAGLLQRVAVGAGSRLVVATSPAQAGETQLSGSQIEKTNHDRFTLLTRAAADSVGILAAATTTGPRVVSADGPAAVAFAKAAEKATEVTSATGVTWIRVTATADPGEGIGDLRALGKVMAMTPKLDFTIELNVELGLPNGQASIAYDGPTADYQKLESDLMRFANHASEAQGSLAVTATTRDTTVVQPGMGEWTNLANNTATLNPGNVTVDAEVATKDTK